MSTFLHKEEKPPIPKLPKTLKELSALSQKKLKVLRRSDPVSKYGGTYHPGGVALTNAELECPFCGMKFTAVEESGCFSSSRDPDSCPNCNFPHNVIKAEMALLKQNRAKNSRRR